MKLFDRSAEKNVKASKVRPGMDIWSKSYPISIKADFGKWHKVSRVERIITSEKKLFLGVIPCSYKRISDIVNIYTKGSDGIEYLLYEPAATAGMLIRKKSPRKAQCKLTN